VTYNFPADTTVQPFYRWTVPARVCSATFNLYGAEGSGGVGGAQVISTIGVTPGAELDVYIAGQGYLGQAGYNGGGGASAGGVGGGGATDVRSGPGLADRILVAGGGGGNGGAGNGSTQGMGGTGGLKGQDGTPQGGNPSYNGRGGKGGTATSGGAGGRGDLDDTNPGQPGVAGVGGNGALPGAGIQGGGGGGGGGGLYGGGGGGNGISGSFGGGGGGGSSLTAGGTVSAIPHPGNGKAIIAYEPSASCTAKGTDGSALNLPTGTNPQAGIARVGRRLRLKGRYALVKLQCTKTETCKGKLGLATTGLPKAHGSRAARKKSTKLGSARFKIAAQKTKTVKVKLSRPIRRRLGKLSRTRLKRLKVAVTAKVGTETTKFNLGATR
jgi:hypothetical protein